uniref:Peptidase S1 domain-containing protein n=1 Tax=Oryza rufipogon TaxID=4529 RepID=A0A0E0NRQ4_ORYRU
MAMEICAEAFPLSSRVPPPVYCMRSRVPNLLHMCLAAIDDLDHHYSQRWRNLTAQTRETPNARTTLIGSLKCIFQTEEAINFGSLKWQKLKKEFVLSISERVLGKQVAVPMFVEETIGTMFRHTPIHTFCWIYKKRDMSVITLQRIQMVFGLGSKVVMVSWPHPTRNRTAVTGEISHPGRQFDELSPVNPLGFTTMLSEVQIRSEQGSSGGPLLNGQVQVTGLLHGGNGSFSFFISLPNGDSLSDLLALIQHCSAPFTSFWMLCVWVNMLRLF